MKPMKFKHIFSFFLAFVLMFCSGCIKINAYEKNFDSIENDLYEEKLINESLNRYLNEDKSLNVVKDAKGNDKIIVNDRITITNIGYMHNDYSLNRTSPILAVRGENVSYNGTVTKPAGRLSDGVYAPKDRSTNIKFSVSGSFSYEISGNFGVNFELFKSELGGSIRKTYTQNTTAEYTVSKNKLGIVYGIRVYDEYKYSGWIRKGTLLSPSHFNMFLVER